MAKYRIDLHIHTVLSPCGDLEMSPQNIILRAKEKGLDMIAITDHNSTRHCRLTKTIGDRVGVKVLFGCEVTSKEEIHCLAYFGNEEALFDFQLFIDANMPDIYNDPDKFGYQVEIDEDENIIYEEPKLLISAINKNIEDISRKVHSLDGIFILAHIDKTKNSVLSQLGFIPFDLEYDALELSYKCNKETFLLKNKYLKDRLFINSSDSHYIDSIGCSFFEIEIDILDFESLIKYFKEHNQNF